jgi:hypothetical protein
MWLGYIYDGLRTDLGELVARRRRFVRRVGVLANPAMGSGFTASSLLLFRVGGLRIILLI